MLLTAASQGLLALVHLKAPEEAGEFPEAPSSCLLRYQHLAKASLTNFFSFQILAVPLCFLTVPSHFLASIRLGRRRREHEGLMSEGLLDESGREE